MDTEAEHNHDRSLAEGTGGDGAERRRVGALTIVAGVAMIVGAPLGAVSRWAVLLATISVALLVYTVPKMHRYQDPADGWTGTWGAWMASAGGAVAVVVALVMLAAEVAGVGLPRGVPATGVIGALIFTIGIVLFGIGSAIAHVFPRPAPLLVVIGLAVVIGGDLVAGAFFGDATPWGSYVGFPLFGLGLAWMGSHLRAGSR